MHRQPRRACRGKPCPAAHGCQRQHGRISGQYRGVFAEIAEAFNLVQDRVNYIADSIEMLSRGDLSRLDEFQKIGRRSEHDRIIPGFIRTFGTLQSLTADAVYLTQAAQKGDLLMRADAAKHEGEYRKIVEGVNGVLDVIIVPFKEVQGAIVQLGSSTEDTSKSSGEIAKASEQVAVTGQRCADLAKQVLLQIENVERGRSPTSPPRTRR